jgi:glycosyltransferase involved in cell wall biosynthesis
VKKSSSMSSGLSQEEENVKVTFSGILTGRQKLEAFTGSDVFVLPSYSENFGMSVVEAMTCRLPVIITNQVGIYKEVANAKAGLVIKTNAEELSMGIRNLLNNTITYKAIQTNGRQLVEDRFVSEKVAGQMAETYDKILTGYMTE